MSPGISTRPREDGAVDDAPVVVIDVGVEGGRCRVTCPGNPGVAAALGKLRGRFDPETRRWSLDPRDEERARQVLREAFGTDGDPEEMADLVAVRWALPRDAGRHARFGGRVVAVRRARDEAVRLAPGVVLVEGELPASGGSAARPRIGAAGPVVLEIRDIPRAMARVEPDGSYELIEGGGWR